MIIKKRRIKYFRVLMISILIITGVVIGGRMLLRKHDSPIIVDYNHGYLRMLDEHCSKMSKDELLRYKSDCENTLENISRQLDSDSLNPEERHETLLVKQGIERELKIVKKHLQK